MKNLVEKPHIQHRRGTNSEKMGKGITESKETFKIGI